MRVSVETAHVVVQRICKLDEALVVLFSLRMGPLHVRSCLLAEACA